MSTNGNRSAATLNVTYVLGDRVLAQADGSGAVAYLLADGKGDTRALANASGAVTAAFSYDAFDNAVGFDPAAAGTMFQAGDGMFDPATGLQFHANGRQSDNLRGRFIIADDPSYVTNPRPITSNLYLLDGADPVDMRDYSGHDFSLASLVISAGINSYLATIEGVTGQVLRNQLIYGVNAGLARTAIEDIATVAAFAVGEFAGAVIGEVASYASEQLAPVLGKVIGSLSSDVVKVFRVEAESGANSRIIVNAAGDVAIQNTERTLFLNFGSRERAVAFLEKRLSQGFSDSVIKSFDVPKSFLKNLEETAVPEALAKRYPVAPIRVDVTKAPGQFGLRPNQIEELINQIIPGSGGIEYPS